MPSSFSIKIFLPDGTPDGLRCVERTNWTGIAPLRSVQDAALAGGGGKS